MAFGDLGMVAIYEFEVEDMPVIVRRRRERRVRTRNRPEGVASKDRGAGGDWVACASLERAAPGVSL
jgi:hypothetical protein